MKRIAYFTYGAVVYTMFLAVLLYLIGFVTGLVVPKSLDGGESNYSAGVAIAINVGLILLFGLQHSVMARPTFKRVWTRIVPKPIERSTYVLATNLALIALFVLWQPINVTVWNFENSIVRYALYGVSLAGFGLVAIVTFLINHFDLFGLRQVWLHLLQKEYKPLGFVTPAIYKLVRHPLYVGWFLAFWSTPTMTLSHLVFAAVNTAYIVTAVYFEERNLVDEHGARYEQYRQVTPKFIPRLKPAPVTTGMQPASQGDAA